MQTLDTARKLVRLSGTAATAYALLIILLAEENDQEGCFKPRRDNGRAPEKCQNQCHAALDRRRQRSQGWRIVPQKGYLTMALHKFAYAFATAVAIILAIGPAFAGDAPVKPSPAHHLGITRKAAIKAINESGGGYLFTPADTPTGPISQGKGWNERILANVDGPPEAVTQVEFMTFFAKEEPAVFKTLLVMSMIADMNHILIKVSPARKAADKQLLSSVMEVLDELQETPSPERTISIDGKTLWIGAQRSLGMVAMSLKAAN